MMNSNQENTTSSTGSLRLPEPDPDNITVLAHNLPSKPILPWNRFDFPSLNKESKKVEQTSQQKSSPTSNGQPFPTRTAWFEGSIAGSQVYANNQIESQNTDSNTSTDEKQENQETT